MDNFVTLINAMSAGRRSLSWVDLAEAYGEVRNQRDELLESLKSLLPYVRGDIGKAGIKACDKAEKAIAKAEPS